MRVESKRCNMRHVLGVILLLIGGPIQAAIVTMDFEGNGPPYNVALPNGYNEDGWSIQYNVLHFFPLLIIEDSTPTNGSAVLLWCGALLPDCEDDLITLMHNDGGTFDLLSLDASIQAAPDGLTTVTGYYAAGGSISTEIALVDGVWNTFNFDAQWSNLVSVGIEGADGAAHNNMRDNVVANVVPIPAAVWLFGSGLGLLVWFARRQSA